MSECNVSLLAHCILPKAKIIKKIVSECMKRIIKIFLLAVLAMFFASLAGIFISEEFVFHNNISGIKDLSGYGYILLDGIL